jgi:hypothetical protein
MALAAIAAWLLHPALTAVHVEGFSASIVSLALHLAAGDISAYDAVFPANLEFFGLSRLGTVLSVAAVVQAFGVSGEWAMRITMWAGFVALVIASCVLVRRWTGASGALAAAPLVLLPGVFESTFFYNDNVLSSAFAVGALAIVASSRRVALTVLAGLLLGYAVVARTDAVLLAPAVPLILFEQYGRGRTFFARNLLFGFGALIPIVLVFAAFGTTIFDVLHISNYAVALWDRGISIRRHVEEVALFVGIPGAILGALGLWQLVGVPVLFNIVCVGKLWQSRQLLPLTPFIAALVVRGWQLLAPAAGRRRGAIPRAAVAAAIVFVVAVPTSWVRVDDGPRTMRGRLWSPRLWTRWQHAIDANFRDVRAFVSGAAAGATTAVITDTWDGDRYLHVSLQDAGYASVAAHAIGPTCARTAELFERGAQRVLHVRLHEPFINWTSALTPTRIDAYALPCLDAARPAATYLLAPLARLDRLLGPDLPATAAVVRERADSTDVRIGYYAQLPVPLTSGALATLRRSYAADAAATVQRTAAARRATQDLAAAERMLAAQVGFPH